MNIAQNVVAGPDSTRLDDFTPKSRWVLLRRILAQPKGLVGLTLVILYLLLAIFGPALAPQDAFRQNFAQTLRPPSAAHWFGTDQLGRDVLSRILVGARATLGIGVGGVAVAFLVGVPLGILAAWRRGWIEAAVMRTIDIMLSFPTSSSPLRWSQSSAPIRRTSSSRSASSRSRSLRGRQGQ